MDLDTLKRSDGHFHSRARLIVLLSFVAAGLLLAVSLIQVADVSMAASLVAH